MKGCARCRRKGERHDDQALGHDVAVTSATQEYDAPASGVICSFRFENGRAEALAEPDFTCKADVGCWSWTHLRLGDVRALALLRSVPDLPPEALELFATAATRVQVAEVGCWVIGVLPDFERDLSGRPQGEGRLIFAFDPTRLLTARLHALLAADDLRHSALAGEILPSPAAAVVAHMQLYVDHFGTELDEARQQMSGIEDYVLTQPRDPTETELSALRRKVAHYRRELRGMRSTLQRAHAARRSDQRVTAFDQELGELLAAVEDLDHDASVLQESGRMLHEEIDTLINAATNRNMRALTIISTLLIPPTLITGAFGMNVPGIPFEHFGGGFAVAITVCVVVVAAALMLMRRLGM
jgi:zinc transporter